MSLRRTAQGIAVAILLTGIVGCGGDSGGNVIPKEKYDQIWAELTDLMIKKKGKQSLKDQDAVLKKYSVERDIWKASIDKYGISEDVMKRQREALDAVMKKIAAPPPPAIK